MLNNSLFTLPTESSKKKYGSEALLGHATRYHGDVNLNYTMLTKIMEWISLQIYNTFSFKDRIPLLPAKKWQTQALIYLSKGIQGLKAKGRTFNKTPNCNLGRAKLS